MNTVLPRILVAFLFILSIQLANAQAVSYSPLYDNTTFAKTIHLSNPVGTIDGAANTTPSGAVTYTIPIKCAPGTHGMVPDLSIAYNSHGGNGLLGQGWNLSGLSVIARTGKDLYHDNKVGPVTYTNDDAFVLDGTRLSPVTGTNGSIGTTYRTESESYSVTTSYGSVGGGPQYFKVVSKDGTIMEYGNTADSRTMTNDGTAVMIWRLNKIQDANGNYITFIYTNTNSGNDPITYPTTLNKKDNDGRDVQLAEIDYTGNANTGLTPYNVIKFEYAVRTDKHDFYDGGSSIASRYLLSNIIVYTEGEQMKEYAFNYGFENAKSYLENVVQYAKNDGVALEDTRFKYGDLETSPTTVTSNIDVTWYGPVHTTTGALNTDVFSGDFDGDGKTEILSAHYQYGGDVDPAGNYDPRIKDYKDFVIYKADASGTAGSYTPISGSSGSWSIDGKHLVSSSNVNGSSKSFITSDFDGDGKDDILFMNTTFHSSSPSDYATLDSVTIYYSRTGSSGFNFDITNYPPASFVMPHSTKTSQSFNIGENNMILGDFDGDKRTDYMYFSASGELWDGVSWTYKRAFVSFPGKGTVNLPVMQQNNLSAYDEATATNFREKKIYVLDFDGDGKSDIMYTDGIYNYVYTLEQAATGEYYFKQIESGSYPDDTYHDVVGIGDFNGDGKDDIVTKSKVADLWEIGFATGKSIAGFENIEFKFQTGAEFQSDCSWGHSGIGTGPSSADPDRLFFADFNGDGKTDILHERSHCGDDYCFKTDFNVYYLRDFDGGTTESKVLYDFQSYTYWGRTESIAGYSMAPILTDVDGDGRKEYSFKNANGCGSSTTYLISTQFNKGGQSLLLQNVTDGFNRTTEFQYKPLTAGTGIGSFYTKGTGAAYPINNGQYASYVVTSIQSPDGIGGTNTANFSYENMRLHRGGRGLLGFQKVIATNANANLRTETTYDLNTDFYVSYPKTTKTFLNSTGAQLTQTDNTVNFNRIGTGYCFTQQATSSTTQDLLKGLTTVSTNTYDTYGNVTNTLITTTGGPETFTSSTSSNFTATAGSPIPNRPSSTTATSQRGSQPSVSTTMVLGYDGQGNVLTSASYPTSKGPSFAVFQRYTYDAYGNVLTSSKESSGISSSLWPTASYGYDTKGRFPIQETNPLGDISYKTYHKFWGKPLTATGVDGLTATYTYDNWGKLSSSYTPTSAGSGYTINYSDGWDISTNKLYYTLVQHPGAPDIKTWYDQLGRPVQTKKEAFGSGWTTAVTTYDNRGNVATSTNNYLDTETPITTTNTYDALNRISSSTNVFGTTNYAYSSGSGQATTTVTEPDGKIKTTVTDGLGKTLKSSNGIAGTVHFSYDSRGNETSSAIGDFGGPIQSLITKQYDDWGRLTTMKDPDAGTSTYTYDAFGQLATQTDPKGKTTAITRDVMGRLTQKTLDGYTTNYTYYGPTKAYQIQQAQVTGPDGTVTDAYDYNTGGTLSSHTKTAHGAALTKYYGYDLYNNLTATSYYPSTFSTTNNYDANGYLQTITGTSAGGAPKTLYQATAQNGNGQTTAYNRVDGLPATISYYNGIPIAYNTPGIQDLSMTYDYTNGNVLERNDHISGTKETFTYDAIDRLTQSAPQKYSVPTATYIPINITYDNNFWGSLGRIQTKTDAGTYNYGGMTVPVARNAVLSVTDPMTNISHADQNITYTPFNKASSIIENIGTTAYTQTFLYDANEDRAYSQQIRGGTTAIKRWYMGDYERAYNNSTGIKDIHYISSPAGLCGIVVGDATGYHYYGAYTDHLGSIVAVTNESGAVVARQSYDAWGRERNPDTWDYAMGTSTKPDWLYRGYTGHEMLSEFDLINMNGRMYDPINGRMMRPDNDVQAPNNTQSYNRYTYCMNNPMKYSDPNGENWFLSGNFSGGHGGFNASLTLGLGVPGISSLQVTLGYNSRNNDIFVGVGGSLAGFTASVGWGTQSGLGVSASYFGNLGYNAPSGQLSTESGGGSSGTGEGFGEEAYTGKYDDNLNYFTGPVRKLPDGNLAQDLDEARLVCHLPGEEGYVNANSGKGITTMQTILDAFDITVGKFLEIGFKQANQWAPSITFVQGAKIVNRVTRGLNLINSGSVLYQGINNGWQINNQIDATVNAAGYFKGVGTAFSMGWYFANILSQYTEQQSLSELIQSDIENYQMIEKYNKVKSDLDMSGFNH